MIKIRGARKKCDFRDQLRSVVGERGKWSGERRGAFSEVQPKRNARRRTADGSPPLMRCAASAARDERAVCETEQAWS